MDQAIGSADHPFRVAGNGKCMTCGHYPEPWPKHVSNLETVFDVDTPNEEGFLVEFRIPDGVQLSNGDELHLEWRNDHMVGIIRWAPRP